MAIPSSAFSSGLESVGSLVIQAGRLRTPRLAVERLAGADGRSEVRWSDWLKLLVSVISLLASDSVRPSADRPRGSSLFVIQAGRLDTPRPLPTPPFGSACARSLTLADRSPSCAELLQKGSVPTGGGSQFVIRGGRFEGTTDESTASSASSSFTELEATAVAVTPLSEVIQAGRLLTPRPLPDVTSSGPTTPSDFTTGSPFGPSSEAIQEGSARPTPRPRPQLNALFSISSFSSEVSDRFSRSFIRLNFASSSRAVSKSRAL